MASFLQLLKLAVRQSIGPQRAPRVPEPSAAMEQQQQVRDYDRAGESKLALSYQAVLWFLSRLPADWHNGRALDVCCGPGHFTCALAKHFPMREVVGMDLSAPMLQAAERRVCTEGLNDRVHLIRANALEIDRLFRPHSFRLITSNNALHHFENLRQIRALLCAFEQLVQPGGWIVLSDLVRLRTPELNDRYVDVLAGDYPQQGLGQLMADFRASMHAAWLPEELAETLPAGGSHRWEIIVPRFLPTIQLIVARPLATQTGSGQAVTPPDLGASGLEWHLLKLSLLTARRLGPLG